jgi:hypothetical protein
MKIRALLRSFFIVDKKRGMSVKIEAGQEFEFDHIEQAEDLFCLLQAGQAIVIDEKFIPKSGKYIILRAFPYRTADGFPRVGQPGAEITLSQEKACELLVSGHIKPVDESGWTLRRLLEPTIKDNVVKRMFDDFEEPKKNWAKDYGKGGNR